MSKGTRKVRVFETGATRDSDDSKLDYDGFLSPEVLTCYAQYMHEHRKQSDGQLRSSDNWKKGIPKEQYMKSMWRHFMSVWTNNTNKEVKREEICALLFNVMGYLHEDMQQR